MEKLGAEQKPSIRDRELTEQESDAVAGGDGPPGTAGDGNGRFGWSLNYPKLLD